MNPLGALQRYAIFTLVLIVAGGLWGGWERHQGHKAGEAEGNARIAQLEARYAAASAKAEAEARAREQASVARQAQIEAYYQQEMRDAKAQSDRVVADLRAGNLRLRREWRGCPATARVPAPGASAAGATGAAALRAADPQRALRDASADRLVGYGAEADALIRALQRVVKADRR